MLENNAKPTILIVEDNKTTALIYQSFLADRALVKHVSQGRDALERLRSEPIDLILLDIGLPDTDGLELLRQIRQFDREIPVIIVTSKADSSLVLTAMQHQATDYLQKPVEKVRFLVTVNNAIQQLELKRKLNAVSQPNVYQVFHGMVAQSKPMLELFEVVRKAAKSDASFFITGESGTGKELFAEAVHFESKRRNRPFVAINCAAIPHQLLESELFGHVKGAFTGANSNRTGAAQRAHSGTLFLDELGELPYELQSKLLRFIERREFTPVGSDRTTKVDVRFICATNRDPLDAIKKGQLREDLYYRLSVIPIIIPPLRERAEDIPLIAQQILKRVAVQEGKAFNAISATAETLLHDYSWPGNVRELINVIRKVVTLNDGPILAARMLPSELIRPAATNTALQNTAGVSVEASNPQDNGLVQPLWLVEKQMIERALQKCNYNIRATARILEVSPSTLYRKMKQWKLQG
ncbi:sigma-54-dependent transcriptional regulator [Pseudidiomarina taiwanensis]|uniref:Sigma-54-dependent Fis family transcriptional regulator n=1 Tax=Pseudidiomarina taiwanensis TaxID=337250 RepID=A0A432ZFF0_9GAMM|nr:sigma-54 dependent transcriptional regulator [Pseudidiomarina taiwanensis]RUO76696.1 sigma-54-dependent Fis family transcriptional regulator [Pseudidiomarina taiwanensis]